MCRKWSKDNSTIFAKCRKRSKCVEIFFDKFRRRGSCRNWSKIIRQISPRSSRCDELCRNEFDKIRQMSMKRDELCRKFFDKIRRRGRHLRNLRRQSTNFDKFRRLFSTRNMSNFFRQISPTFFDRKIFLFPTTFDKFRQGIVERCRILSEEVELCRIIFDKIRFPSTQSTAFFDSIRQSSAKSVGTMKRLSNDVEPCRMMSRI